MRLISTLFFIVLILSSCIETPDSYSKLPPGKWRGILKLTDPDIEITPETLKEEYKISDYFELPFNMEVSYDENDELQVFLLNGDERIQVESVHYGRDPRTAKDTLQLNFIAFDTHIDAFYEENIIEGHWHVDYKEGYSIPFIAFYGEHHRFDTKNLDSEYDVNGKWQVEFSYDNAEKAYPAIAEFEQDGTQLKGTFETETGDYRFLQGNVFGSKIRLSVFDGAHAFLFRAEIENDTIYGEFRSGKHYKTKWKAYRQLTKSLKDPYDMTKARSLDPISFDFIDSEGAQLSFAADTEPDKIKLINIMGTWCPNCRDEIELLKEIQSAYGKDKVSIYSIAFEKYRSEDEALAILKKYKDIMQFDWPLLLGGYANKSETSEVLGFVDKIYSYPTLLLLDKSNRIRHIHTGFYGPATSKHAEFKESIIKRVEEEINN